MGLSHAHSPGTGLLFPCRGLIGTAIYPLGREHELHALLGLLLSPPFLTPGPAALFSPPVTLPPGSTAAVLLSILAFLSYKTPTLGEGFFFLFEQHLSTPPMHMSA